MLCFRLMARLSQSAATAANAQLRAKQVAAVRMFSGVGEVAVPHISRSKRSLKPTMPLRQAEASSFDDSQLKITLAYAVENGNRFVALKAFNQLLKLCAIEERKLTIEPELVHKMIAFFTLNVSEELGRAALMDTLELVEKTFSLLPAHEVTESDLKPLLQLLEWLNYSEKFQGIWTHLVEAAKEKNREFPQLSLETYNLVLHYFGQCGLVEETNEAFDLLVKASTPVELANGEFSTPFTQPPNDVSYLNLISSHISCSPPDLNGALAHFEKMAIKGDPSPTVPIFNTLIQAAGRVKDFETANLLFDTLESAGLYPNHFTYNILINAYAKVGDFDKAAKILDEWNNEALERNSDYQKPKLSPPTRVTFNTLMTMCARFGGSEEEAEALLKSMVQTVGVNQITATAYMDVFKRKGEELGVPKFTEGYNVLLSCFGYVRNMERMDQVYTEMINNNCRPSPVTFRILLMACRATLDLHRMEFWVAELETKFRYELDERMMELIAETLVREAKLSPDRKAVLPAVSKYVGQRNIHSTRLFNAVLEAHFLDDMALNSGKPLDILAILQVNRFSDHLYRKRKVQPSVYALRILLDAVERGLSRSREVVNPRGTLEEFLRLYVFLADKKIEIDDVLHAQMERVKVQLSQSKK
ncbi:hypothetical protein BDR26DRAFT_851141, partial [Obelidium mucronatum]